jgi:hypothetical protein
MIRFPSRMDTVRTESDTIPNLALKTVWGWVFRRVRAACRKAKTFAYHVLKVAWRCLTRKQYGVSLLPNHCFMEIDFSMNFSVVVTNAPQPMHFSPQGVTVLCIIIQRHAILAVDGFESTLAEPRIVKDHVVVFIEDLKHDATVRLSAVSKMNSLSLL